MNVAKRDYYEILGVERTADDQGLKAPIGSWRCNSIRTATRTIMMRRRSLRKPPKPIAS